MRRGRWLASALVLVAVGTALAQAPPNDGAIDPAQLRAAMRTEQSLLRQLYGIDHLRYQHEKSLGQINGELAELGTAIDGEATAIAALESDMPVRGARLGRRLSAMYRLGRGGFWRVLLTSDSFRTFLQRYRALQRIVRADAEALTSHRVQLLALREKKEDLERRRAHLVVLREKEKAESLAVAVEKRKKLFLLGEIRRDKTLAARLASDIDAQDNAMGQTIARLPAVAAGPMPAPQVDFAGRKGYLPSPATGPIVGWFGTRRHAEFGTQTRSNGIDIEAPAGSAVRAVADGTVRYIGEFLGYGRVMILDHGNRFHTLYGHLGGFSRARGDQVRAGEAIGTVGTTGLFAEATLHFEIRHKGVALDPMDWLAPNP